MKSLPVIFLKSDGTIIKEEMKHVNLISRDYTYCFNFERAIYKDFGIIRIKTPYGLIKKNLSLLFECCNDDAVSVGIVEINGKHIAEWHYGCIKKVDFGAKTHQKEQEQSAATKGYCRNVNLNLPYTRMLSNYVHLISKSFV